MNIANNGLMMEVQQNVSQKKKEGVSSMNIIDKRQVMKAFNDHFIEFFEDVERVFPMNTEITSAKRAIITFRKLNPLLLITVFYKSVGQIYRQHIDEGNLNFFVEKDYTKEVKSLKNSDRLIQKINALREPVNNMCDSDQKKVITYLNNLVYLADLFHENI